MGKAKAGVDGLVDGVCGFVAEKVGGCGWIGGKGGAFPYLLLCEVFFFP